MLTRAWRWFWSPAPYAWGGVLILGGVLGILFWGGFNWAMELSNREAFCVSCHEMATIPYAELKTTAHYTNRTGVRATCSDCHVPREWNHKVVRKIQATNELFHKIMGTVDTPEKFAANRMEMAKRVWAGMKATDSRECRNCHDLVSMDPEKQVRPARRRHEEAKENGKTCIECHQGIAHKLPPGWEKVWEDVAVGR